MITENLIKKIECGKAEYKTYCTGGSGAAFLEVPKNHHIVITDFIYNHFIDTSLANLRTVDDLRTIFSRALHNVTFKSGQTRFIYAFRTNCRVYSFTDNLLAVTWAVMPMNDAETVNCYQLHQSDVNIAIFGNRAADGWGIINDFNDFKSNSEAAPAGYGNNVSGGFTTIQSIDFENGFGGAAQYLPLATKSVVAPNSSYRNEFRGNVNVGTKLNTINQTFLQQTGYTFPIINIGYVLIKEPYNGQ
jgi:hypothetical protein